MNLLDTASLVVTPNGYKASKLYSIIPSDGTGDMTFARTGDTATRVNSSGLIETVLANKPRLDYFNSTCPKLLLEPQRTNVLTYSDDFSNATAWTYANTTYTNNAGISPDGTQNADQFATTNNNSYIVRTGAVTISADTLTRTGSIFVKWVSGYEILKFRIALYGTAIESILVLNIKTGALVSNIGTYKIENYGNGWYRISLNITNNSTSTLLPFQILPTNDSTQTGTCLLYGGQLEAGAYATSYIPTTTASVTRNADSSIKTGISSLLASSEYTLFFNGIQNVTGQYNSFCTLYDSGNVNNSIRFYRNNTNNEIRASINNASPTVNIDFGSGITTTNIKVALRAKAGSYALYVNGVAVYNTNSGIPPTVINSISIDYLNSSQAFGLQMNSLAIWKTGLQNSELATLTTI